ncbi:MAG: hypothetical protein ACLRWP_21665, partial [Bilophila wadsworthia]
DTRLRTEWGGPPAVTGGTRPARRPDVMFLEKGYGVRLILAMPPPCSAFAQTGESQKREASLNQPAAGNPFSPQALSGGKIA